MLNPSTENPPKDDLVTNQQEKKQSGWQQIVSGIVRPPRSQYRQSILGSRTFMLNQSKYERKQVQIMHQNKKLVLMTFQPQFKGQWIILYLHGNSSSKVQATSILKYLPFRFSLASFDFIGCGRNTEAETITLGVREAQQVQTVAKYLRLQKWKVVLWGRSMGAATALKYGKAPIIVADSSFHCFRSLCLQKVKQNAPKMVPNCLVSCFFPCVYQKLRLDVKQRANYDINELNITEDVKKIGKQTMVVFMNGDEDQLIDKINSQKLYNSFEGVKKYLEIFSGTHNTKRPEKTIRKVMAYITQFIDEEESTTKTSKAALADNEIVIQ